MPFIQNVSKNGGPLVKHPLFVLFAVNRSCPTKKTKRGNKNKKIL